MREYADEKRDEGHKPYAGRTAHVPLTDVLIEGGRVKEDPPACRHEAEGEREGGQSVRSRDTAVVWGMGSEWIGW